MSHRIATVVAITLTALSVGVPAAPAHIQYDGSGRFMHQSHSRDLGFYNGVDDPWWREETRNAQLDWHSIMNGSLRYYSVAHDSASIHAVDDNYGYTEWYGYAYNWHYHGGHGHLQLNNYWGAGFNRTQMRAVSCHEMGHFSGLMHTTDASDCMNFNFATNISTGHRDQLRSAWNSWGH